MESPASSLAPLLSFLLLISATAAASQAQIVLDTDNDPVLLGKPYLVSAIYPQNGGNLWVAFGGCPNNVTLRPLFTDSTPVVLYPVPWRQEDRPAIVGEPLNIAMLSGAIFICNTFWTVLEETSGLVTTSRPFDYERPLDRFTVSQSAVFYPTHAYEFRFCSPVAQNEDCTISVGLGEEDVLSTNSSARKLVVQFQKALVGSAAAAAAAAVATLHPTV